MKKLVCGCFGNIYYATILKNGLMSSKDRVNVTDDAIAAVFQHLTSQDTFKEKGIAGYEYDKSDKSGTVEIIALDTSKYKLVRKEET